MEKIEGIIERITFYSEDSGWCVFKVSPLNNPNQIITVTTFQSRVYAGATMEFTGEWFTHQKFGRQFKASNCIEKQPATAAALEKYLGSGLIKGVGPKTAKKIVDTFKEETLNVFEQNINRLIEVSGISRSKLKSIEKAWTAHKDIRDVMIFLQKYGVSTLLAVKIYKLYKENSIKFLTDDPYCLSRDIWGVGFATADQIAQNMGLPCDSDKRIKAAIIHILDFSKDSGHCYLTLEQIINNVSILLKDDFSNEIPRLLKILLEKEFLKSRLTNSIDNDELFYSKKIFESEDYVALKIKMLNHNYDYEIYKATKWLEQYNSNQSFNLSEEQSECVLSIVKNGFSVLTGGPGCGKTTTTKAIVDFFSFLNKKVLLAAPTGRAAQRMGEVIGIPSKTIHRLLLYNPSKGGFQKSQDEPLEGDILIIDECSMLDINLASSLLKAVNKSMQVIFIGDVDQLPAVGAGNVLNDIISSKVIPVYTLKKVFRQANESLIIKTAHSINNGELPLLQNPFQFPEIWKNKVDVLFINSEVPREDDLNKVNTDLPKAARYKLALDKIHPFSSLKYELTAHDVISKLAKEWITKYWGKQEIQVLSPMTRGSLGTIYINSLLQNTLNPLTSNSSQLEFLSKIFRVGDRVIQKKNNYDLEVFNGDIGYITDLKLSENQLFVKFEHIDHPIKYEKQFLNELDLAYAITIHKSQGSEFDVVIIPIVNQHFKMLYRNLIYTGLTRAKKLVVFVGIESALNRSIKNIDNKVRQSYLSELLNT